MEIINWLREGSGSGECLMLRTTIDYKDSDAKTNNWTVVNPRAIFEIDWWESYNQFENAGTYTQTHESGSDIMLKWAVATANDNLDDGTLDEIREKIETICADPSRWVKQTWTVSFWLQDDGTDYETVFTILNPNG